MKKDPTRSFDLRKMRSKWGSKAEYETVGKVRDRLEKMKDNKENSCPWASPSQFNVSANSSYHDHWNLCYKLWSQYHEYLEGRSNLKSPISFAPVEAIMAEFQENVVGTTLTATKDEDKNKVKIQQAILEQLHYTMERNVVNEETMHECAITGSSIRYTGWISNKREVDIILGSKEIETASEEERQKWQELLDNGKPITKKQTIVEYNNIGEIPVSVYEFYVDENARNLHGRNYAATDCIWRTTPSLEQARAELKNSSDPFIIKANVDKIYPAKQSLQDSDETPFFEAASDLVDDQVEFIKYYNKATDKYIIVVNDILLRDGPLPYNHKQLPFSLHRLIKFPHLFWGVGIPTILESLQSEDETLRNMMLDQMKINLTPPIFISSDIYSDIDDGWDTIEPGQKIEVSGPVDSAHVRWFEGSQYRPDYFQMRNIIREDVFTASGVNPLAYSVPKPGEAVRNNVMSLESTLKMIKKDIKNYSEGILTSTKQILALMKQFYPSEILSNDKTKSIRIDGYELEADEMGELQKKNISGSSYLELEDEYFDVAGDIEVMVDVDTMVPISRGLKMQKIEQAMAQLIPILSNPASLQVPGVTQMVREYIETHGLSDRIIEQLDDESDDKEVEMAKLQQKDMFNLMQVPGIPGESPAHKFEHTQTLLRIVTELVDPNVDPMVAQKLMQVQQVLTQHLMTDDMPKSVAPKVAVSNSQAAMQATQTAQPQRPLVPPSSVQGALAPSTNDVLGGQGMGETNPMGQVPQGTRMM